MIPLYFRLVFNMRHRCIDINAKCGFSIDKIQLSYYMTTFRNFFRIGTYFSCKSDNHSYFLPFFLHMQFAEPVSGLHDFRRLNKNSLSSRTLVMHYTIYLSFKSRRNRYHQTAVAHCRSGIFFNYSRRDRPVHNTSHGTLHCSAGSLNGLSHLI